jgi:putative peptidoglycan lipid II flippase
LIESPNIPPAGERPPPIPPPTEPDMRDNGIARAAAVLALGNVASRALGLVREMVKAHLFGASGSGLVDAFTIAAYVPMGLYELIVGGMVNSSLVPVFSDYAQKEKRDELWGLVSVVLSVAVAVLSVLVILVELFAPQVAWLVGAYNLETPGLTETSISLLRLAAPAVLFLGVSSILTGALYALRRFTLPAFIGAAFNGSIVLAALLRPDEISSLVWGLLLGSLLQIGLQLPALRGAKIQWRLDWRHPALRRIIRLYLPILAGLVINQAAVAISYNLATRTGVGSVAYMVYATTLYQFPLGLVVTALSIATLPTLSTQAIQSLPAFKQTLADGVNMALTLILPATAGLFALALPIAALLFERGEFTPQDTAQTALVLRVYLIGLPFAAVDQMLIFASYARKDTWRPALVGVISIIIYLIVAVALLRPLGLLSLMVADAVKHIVHTLIMLWLLKRHLGGLGGYGVIPRSLKSLLAAGLTGLAAYGAANLSLIWLPGSDLISRLLVVLFAGTGGLIVYIGLAWSLNIREALTLPQLLWRR